MAKDGPHNLRQSRLKKRILDDQIAKPAPMLQVFAVENLAATLDGSSHDQRIVPRELIAPCQVERAHEESWRGMHQQQGPQSSVPVSLEMLEAHRVAKRFPRNRNKLLRYLVADHPGTRRERFCDKILGTRGFVGSLRVKGIDKNVRVEKVLSGAHSSRRA
jgi:hypothetical protein